MIPWHQGSQTLFIVVHLIYIVVLRVGNCEGGFGGQLPGGQHRGMGALCT